MLFRRFKQETITLVFSPEFPGYEGAVKELKTSRSKRVFVLGRASNSDLVVSNPNISRVHVSIYFDEESNHWMILNGGMHPDGYAPCKNAPYWNSETLQPEQPRPIAKGDRVLLLPRYRLVVASSVSDTSLNEIWNDEYWPVLQPQRVVRKNKALEKKLNQEVSLGSLMNWLMAPPQSGWEILMKLIVGVSVAIAIAAITYLSG